MNASAVARHANKLPGWVRWAGFAVVALAVAGGAYWYVYARFFEATDDAYIQADITQLSARVSGTVASLPVAENARVVSGTLLMAIDDRDYRLALEDAQGKVATQEATLARLTAQLDVQQGSIRQAEAQVAANTAESRRAVADAARYAALVSDSAVSPVQLDQAQADAKKARANLRSAQAAQEGAQAQLVVLQAQLIEAQRTLEQLKTGVAQAVQNLAYTQVRAPVDGTFGNRGVDVGALVQPGTRLGVVVPLHALYVEANFKETQLAHIKPGQPVQVRVDALGGRVVRGRVESVAPASGATFSLLPPENATGNFTKIIQRVPVRIALPADADALLRPGLSVVVRVDTR